MGDSIASYSEEELEAVEMESIDHLLCTRCGHTWEPRKHPTEYERVGCPNKECGCQAKSDIELVLVGESGGGTAPEAPMQNEEGDAGFGNLFRDDRSKFAGMTPGDFVTWFFEDEFEDKNIRNVEMLKKKCDAGNVLPTKGEMEWVILNLNTGIGNQVEAEWISGIYWQWAKRYLSYRTDRSEDDIDLFVLEKEDIGWVQLTDIDNSSGPSGGVASLSAVSDGGQSRAASMDSQPSREPRAQQPRTGGQPTQPMQNQQSPSRDKALLDAIKQLSENQQQLSQRIEQSESMDFSQFANQFREMKSVMNEMTEETRTQEQGQNDEVKRIAEAFNSRLKQIEEQIENSEPDPTPSGDGPEGLLYLLAQREDVESDQLINLASEIGNVESDPEVKKAEIEKEMRELEIESEGEKREKTLEKLESISENVVDSGITSLVQNLSDRGDSDEVEHEPRQQRDIQQPDLSGFQQQQGQPQPVDPEPYPEPQPQRQPQPVERAPEPQPDPRPEPETEPDPEPEPESSEDDVSPIRREMEAEQEDDEE